MRSANANIRSVGKQFPIARKRGFETKGRYMPGFLQGGFFVLPQPRDGRDGYSGEQTRNGERGEDQDA
jgi:hypothetical protein